MSSLVVAPRMSASISPRRPPRGAQSHVPSLGRTNPLGPRHQTQRNPLPPTRQELSRSCEQSRDQAFHRPGRSRRVLPPRTEASPRRSPQSSRSNCLRARSSSASPFLRDRKPMTTWVGGPTSGLIRSNSAPGPFSASRMSISARRIPERARGRSAVFIRLTPALTYPASARHFWSAVAG
jgi:hypothetical protein